MTLMPSREFVALEQWGALSAHLPKTQAATASGCLEAQQTPIIPLSSPRFCSCSAEIHIPPPQQGITPQAVLTDCWGVP